MAPEQSRIEQKPVVMTPWGHSSLSGNDTDRLVVPSSGPDAPSQSGTFLCALAGFFGMSLLFGR